MATPAQFTPNTIHFFLRGIVAQIIQSKHHDQSSALNLASQNFANPRAFATLKIHRKTLLNNFIMAGPYSQFLDLDNTRDPYLFEDSFLNDIPLFGPNEYQQPYNPPQPQYQSPYSNNFQPPAYQSPYSNPPYQQPMANAYIQPPPPPPPPQQPQNEAMGPPSKRLRSRAPKLLQLAPRSTTPDVEPPYHLTLFSPNNLPGTVSSLLTAHLQVPVYTTLDERTRRETEIKHLFS
ncbi:hypothetical protein CSAL01_10046, partial [Colletotrichum salicis]